MQGYQLTFFTQQGRTHGALPITDWLLKEAKSLGIRGATVNAAQSGYGRDGKYRSSRFFELGDQPMEVTMAVGEEEAERLFARINEENLKIFYMKIPAEFGITGDIQ